MGCASSISDKQRLYPQTFMKLLVSKLKFDNRCIGMWTAEERLIVTYTWKRMTNDIQGNGMQVFLRIFEIAPDVKTLFSIQHVRPRDVVRNPVIIGHASRFMQAIGAAVERINECEGSNDFDEQLHRLGKKHTHFKGFKPNYFEVFYNAIMWQWERYMGETFTKEVADAWSHVFAYVMWRLKEGYYGNYDDKDTDSGCKVDKSSLSSEHERDILYIKFRQ